MLGLRYSNDILVPETFIVDDTDYYIKNQISYEIVHVTKEKAKKQEKVVI